MGDLVIGFCHGTLTFYLAFTHVNIIWSILLLLASYVAWRRPFPTFTSGDKSFPAHFPAHIVYDCATKTRNGFKFFFSFDGASTCFRVFLLFLWHQFHVKQHYFFIADDPIDRIQNQSVSAISPVESRVPPHRWNLYCFII